MPEPSPTCLLCNYSLAGLDTASPCPECGASASAARELPPLTARTWARSLVLMTISPRRVLAQLTPRPESDEVTLTVNLAISWILISISTLATGVVENINDQRLGSTFGDAVVDSLPLLVFGVGIMGLAACYGIAATFLALAAPAVLSALLARARRQRLDRRRTLAIGVCASYSTIPVAVLAMLVTTTLCIIALARHSGGAAALYWYTGDPLRYVLFPAGAATIAVSVVMMVWGLAAAGRSPPEAVERRPQGARGASSG